MSKKETFFFGGFWLWLGVVIGFLLSPVKKGMEIGSNNMYDNGRCERRRRRKEQTND